MKDIQLRIINQLGLLEKGLLDMSKETEDLKLDVAKINRSCSEETINIIEGTRRDALMIRDQIARIRKKVLDKKNRSGDKRNG